MHSLLMESLCTYLMLRASLCSAVGGRLYTTYGKYTIGAGREYQVAAGFVSMCAVICNDDERCVTFSYDRTSKICYLSEGAVSTGEVYWLKHGHCPRTRGYDVFVPPANPICLKYYPIKLPQVNATAVCRGDGAHLVLIEDESMLTFLADILPANNWGSFWVDGFDEDDDGNYETFRGDPLPYVPPGSIMKGTPGHQCIRFQPSGRKFNDLPCNEADERYILCQIDM